MAGKGSEPRPVDRIKFDANYERIFGTDEEVCARRQLRIVQQKLDKVKLNPDMEIQTVPMNLKNISVDKVKRTIDAMDVAMVIPASALKGRREIRQR